MREGLPIQKVGLLNTRGLPARYGAYEQTIDQLVSFNSKSADQYLFFVPCIGEVYDEPYQSNNVVRKKIYRPNRGYGAIVYGLLSFLWAYYRGCRIFFFFGYSLAPFFWFFSLLGCQLICNTDGIEWRRAKWGKYAKYFLKFCEWTAVKSGANLIFDADAIARYYMLNHKRAGHRIFYGTETQHSIGDCTPSYHAAELLRSHGLLAKQYDVAVMRLEPENNIEMIVDGYRRFKSKRKLLIIGPSTPFFVSKVEKKIHGSENIVYVGAIYDRQTLMSLRKNAHCYIHGHSVGGTNPVLVEAVALGRPIIAFGSMFNKEVLGRNGFFFRNSEGVLRCLKQLDKGGFHQLPKLDRRYTWNYVLKQYMDLIEGK